MKKVRLNKDLYEVAVDAKSSIVLYLGGHSNTGDKLLLRISFSHNKIQKKRMAFIIKMIVCFML